MKREETTIREAVERVREGIFYEDHDYASGPGLRALSRAADRDDFDYMAEADKTCSVIFNPQNVDRDAFFMLLERMVADSKHLNIAKKLLFRGKSPVEVGTSEPALHESLAVEFDRNNPVTGEIDILHGIVGVLTEAGEMAEVLLHRLKTGSFDTVNAFEEVGDVTWYLARQLRGLGTTFDVSNRANIDKLHGRHGNAFDVFRDANRNLHAERERLETSAPLFESVISYEQPHNENAGGLDYGQGENRTHGDESAIDEEPKQFTHAPMHHSKTVGQYARRMTGAEVPGSWKGDTWGIMCHLAKSTQLSVEQMVQWSKDHWSETVKLPNDAALRRFATDARYLHPVNPPQAPASEEGCESVHFDTREPGAVPPRPVPANVGTKTHRDPPGVAEHFERKPIGDCEGMDC